MMEEHPDSALALLDSMELAGIGGDEDDQARYALLRTQALDKNYINVHDDSLIRVAVRHYYEDSRERMLAHYYLARVYYNKEYLPGSLRAALEAKRLAEKLQDYYYLGLTGYTLADIYREAHNAQEELRGAELSINAFAKLDKERHLLWAHYLRALALYNANMFQESKALLDSVSRIAQKKKDSTLLNNLHETFMLLASESYDSAFHDSIPYYFYQSNQGIKYIIPLLKYYFGQQQQDSVDKYLQIAEGCLQIPYDSLFVNQHKAIRLYQQGEKDAAFILLEKTLYNMDSLYHSFQNAKISSLQADFYYQQVLDEIAAKKEERRIWLGIVSCTVFVLVLTSLFFYERMRHKKLEMEMYIAQVSQLQQQIATAPAETEYPRCDIGLIFKQQFDTINQLCQAFSQTPQNEEKTKLYNQIRKIILKLRSAESLAMLEQSINLNHNNILTRIEECTETLPVREKEMLVCLSAGLSLASISMLLQMNMSNVYVTKSRLKTRIGNICPQLMGEISSLWG